jgi:hypothetical protein
MVPLAVVDTARLLAAVLPWAEALPATVVLRAVASVRLRAVASVRLRVEASVHLRAVATAGRVVLRA